LTLVGVANLLGAIIGREAGDSVGFWIVFCAVSVLSSLCLPVQATIGPGRLVTMGGVAVRRRFNVDDILLLRARSADLT